MTWVIGSPTIFGYAGGASDIQVSWRSNVARHDCLQKVYQVAPFITAGFSGSVRLGFQLLEDLVQFLSPAPEPGLSWIPRWVALKWHRRGRRIFHAATVAERELGSSIILMGVRPTDNSGCIVGGHPDVIVMSAKSHFEPEFVNFGDITSIGSGNNVEIYMKELKSLPANVALMKAEIGSPGGMGRAWGSTLARLLRCHPAPGISQYVHHILVWQDRVEIQALNLTKFTADGNKTAYHMPEVAQTWGQFVIFPKKAGLSAGEAQA
jgi:hypothetical protein